MRSQIFRQIVQIERRRADARQAKFCARIMRFAQNAMTENMQARCANTMFALLPQKCGKDAAQQRATYDKAVRRSLCGVAYSISDRVITFSLTVFISVSTLYLLYHIREKFARRYSGVDFLSQI